MKLYADEAWILDLFQLLLSVQRYLKSKDSNHLAIVQRAYYSTDLHYSD